MSEVAWCTFRHVSNSDIFVKMATTTILLLSGCFCLNTNIHWWWCICWTTTCQINKFAPHSKQSPTEQHQRSQVTSSSVTVMDNNPTRRDRLGQTTDCSSVKRFCNNSSSAHVGMDRKTLCPPEPKIHWTTKGGSIESCCGLISGDLIIIITTDDSELLVRGQRQRGRTEIATMNHLFTTTECCKRTSPECRALVGFCWYWLANDQFSGLVLWLYEEV